MSAGTAPDLATVSDPLAPPPAPRRRGRKPGFRLPTFAQLDELTLEDFSFVRGVYNGMDAREAFLRFYANIHFDAQGQAAVPHGLSLAARYKHLHDRIVSTAASSAEKQLQRLAQTLAQEVPEQSATAAQKHSLEELFEEWLSRQPVDMYSESELPERFKEYLADEAIEITAAQGTEVDRATLIERKVKALNELQTALAYRPRPDSQLGIWLAGPVRKALLKLGITTAGQLVSFIAEQGRTWYRQVDRLGEVRAARLLAWLDDHAATLGPIRRRGPAWEAYRPLKSEITPLQRAPQVVMLEYKAGSQVAEPGNPGVVLRRGIAPLELLQVPQELDGSRGIFRGQAPNHFGASTDMQAVNTWLATFLAAKRMRTFEAYRREAERFYIWCLQEARVALSSVSTAHAMGYQLFLAKIPAAYIGNARVTREDPRWRPWRGQLTPKSQRYALTVIRVMMEALTNAGYLSGNPFASIKDTIAIDRSMDTSRSLDDGDIQWVRALLAERQRDAEEALMEHSQHLDPIEGQGMPRAQPLSSPFAPPPSQRVARLRRLKLIINTLLTTGLRLEELSKATMASLYPAPPDGTNEATGYLLSVVGKGKRVRTVFISERVHAMIEAHHRDVEEALVARYGPQCTQLQAFREQRPMIASLSPLPSAPGAPPQKTGFGLGVGGLYRTLKAFLRSSADHELRETLSTKRAVSAARHKAGAAGHTPEFEDLTRQLREIERAEAIWRRRAAISTHWLRHTFAREALKRNPSDTGLKLTQQLLGHASIATTALYIKQDDADKVKAARLVFPDPI